MDLFINSSFMPCNSLLLPYQQSSSEVNTKHESVAAAQSSRNPKAPLNWHKSVGVTRTSRSTRRSSLLCLSHEVKISKEARPTKCCRANNASNANTMSLLVKPYLYSLQIARVCSWALATKPEDLSSKLGTQCERRETIL